MEGSFLKRWQASLRSRWSVLPSICTYPTPAQSACPVPSSSCASFLMTSLHQHCQFRHCREVAGLGTDSITSPCGHAKVYHHSAVWGLAHQIDFLISFSSMLGFLRVYPLREET